VVFEGVTDLSTRRETPRPDEDKEDRLELSVIEVEREATAWRICVNPYYIEEIEFRCRTAWLDGAALVGEGRWLQDSLPAQPHNS
jgi:hypothetical protein